MSENTNPSLDDAIDEDGSEKKGGINLLILLPLIIFGAMAILFLLQMAKGTDPSRIPSVLINKPAPQFDLPPINAQYGFVVEGVPMQGFSSADLKGKVSVVNIWASWCPTCRDEHPLLLEMNKDNRYQLLGLAYKDEEANAARFLKNHGNAFDRVGLDLNGRVGIDWGVYGAPETFIVDKTGTIRYKHIGALTPKSLMESFLPKLEEILAEG